MSKEQEQPWGEKDWEVFQRSKARIAIRHPLGLLLDFPADHPNAAALVEFGRQCGRDIEKRPAPEHEDWSI